MMMTREVIEKSYQSVNSGDWETYLSLYDEEMTSDLGNIERNQIVEDTSEFNGQKRREGFDAIKEAVRGIQEGYSRFQNNPVLVVVEGEYGMVICHIQGMTTSGFPIDGRVVDCFRVKNGKIIEMGNFADPAVFKPFVEENIPSG